MAEWTAMVEAWEQDQSRPDPYELKLKSELSAIGWQVSS